MSIDNSKKIIDIQNFLFNEVDEEKGFLKRIEKYGVSESNLKIIKKNISEKISDDVYLEKIDTTNPYSLVSLAVGDGLKYNDGEATYFKSINDSFINSVVGNYGMLTENASVLPSVKEAIPYTFGTILKDDIQNIYNWFFTGNGTAFNNYLNEYLTVDEIKSFDELTNGMEIDKFSKTVDLINSRKLEKKVTLKESLIKQKEMLEETRNNMVAEPVEETVKPKTL